MMAIYAPLIGVGIGLWLFALAFKRPRRPRRLGRTAQRPILVPLLGLILCVLCALLALRGLNQRAYARVETGAPVAEVAIKALFPTPQTYSVTLLRLADGKRNSGCILKGERWTVRGASQSWHWWSFGPERTYTLATIESWDTRSEKPISVCDIAVAKPKIDTYLPGSLVDWLIDTARSEERPLVQKMAAPLSDGAAFTLINGEAGLVAKPDASESVSR